MIPTRAALYVLGALALAAPAAYGYGAYRRRAASATASTGRGWVVEPDVVLSDWAIMALDATRMELPLGPEYDLLVTSGTRTATEQALAMQWRINRHGVANTVSLYRDRATAQKVCDLIVAGDMAGAATVLEETPLSAHQYKQAVDISYTRYATGAEIPEDKRESRRTEIGSAAGRAGISFNTSEKDVIHLGG